MNSVERTRIAITGVGIVSAIEVGKDAAYEGISSGHCGIKPISIFDTSDCRSKMAAEIPDFQPQEILGKKGLRLLDRTTRLALCASQLALDESRFRITSDNAGAVGIVLSSTSGDVESRSEFLMDAIRGGPRAVNPALFPNTVMNSPASQAAIRFGIRGPATTISVGCSGTLVALEYAANMLRWQRANAILVGGVESLNRFTHGALDRLGFLARQSKERAEILAPYDRRRNGTVLGEGAAIFLLERLEDARRREAAIHAEYIAGGNALDRDCDRNYSLRSGRFGKLLQQVISNAAMSPENIDAVYAGANSHLIGDAQDARASNVDFQSTAASPLVTAPKSMFGETLSAGAGFQVACALLANDRGIIAPTLQCDNPDDRCRVNCIGPVAKQQKVSTTLVSSVGPLGDCAACVLSSLSD